MKQNTVSSINILILLLSKHKEIQFVEIYLIFYSVLPTHSCEG